MSDEYIIGIDPGITGAIAFFAKGAPQSVVDIPTMQRNKTGTAQMVNGSALADILLAQHVKHAYLELVKGLPRGGSGGTAMGATSAFNFGRTFGAIEQALASARIPFTLIPPEVWKRKAGLLHAEKDASRTLAIRIWPKLAPLLQRKKDGGRAEALLIAYHGASRIQTELETRALLETDQPI